MYVLYTIVDLESEKYDTNFRLPVLVEVRVCNTIYKFSHGLPFTIYNEELTIESYSELRLSFQADPFYTCEMAFFHCCRRNVLPFVY